MPAPIFRTGRILLAEGHTSTETFLSNTWVMDDDFSRIVLWVWSTRGGNVTIHSIPEGKTIINRIPMEVRAIPPNDLTAIAIDHRVPRGCVSFVPTDSVEGTTWADFDSSQ